MKEATSSLHESFFIAVTSVFSFVVLLLIFALVSYCYRVTVVNASKTMPVTFINLESVRRKELYGKSESPLLKQDAESLRSSVLPIRPVTYRVSTVYGKTVLVPNDPTFKVSPNPKTSGERDPMYHPSAQVRIAHYTKGQYNTHPNNGVRIMSVTHPSVPVQYKRPVVLYHQEGVKPNIPSAEQPHTVPHVRHMGAYKPKVIQDYFSPHNIRQYVSSQSVETPGLDSSYSTDYGSTGAGRHVWYPVKQEKIQLMQSDKKVVQMRQDKNKRSKRQKSKLVSSAHYDTGEKQNENMFTIIDYLVDKDHKQGPISTSTPRDRVDQFSVDTAPNFDLSENKKRQRKPHEGSIDKIPLLY